MRKNNNPNKMTTGILYATIDLKTLVYVPDEHLKIFIHERFSTAVKLRAYLVRAKKSIFIETELYTEIARETNFAPGVLHGWVELLASLPSDNEGKMYKVLVDLTDESSGPDRVLVETTEEADRIMSLIIRQPFLA